MIFCPNCSGRAIGKVGTNQYYCWDCFVEFNTNGNAINIYDIAEDGSLVSLNTNELTQMEVDIT